jgi:hypothetical protein
MSPFLLLALQMAMSFVVFGGLARDFVQPALAARPRPRAIAALLWVHAFRFVPLALYAPGQIESDVPPLAVATVAWGDFASSLFALAALIALRHSMCTRRRARTGRARARTRGQLVRAGPLRPAGLREPGHAVRLARREHDPPRLGREAR